MLVTLTETWLKECAFVCADIHTYMYMVAGKSLCAFSDDQKAGGGNLWKLPQTFVLIVYIHAKANINKTTQVTLKTVQELQKLPLNLAGGVFNHCRPEKALCNLCNQRKLYLRCGFIILVI